jgi:c(7)-type cytochrome triheme protein
MMKMVYRVSITCMVAVLLVGPTVLVGAGQAGAAEDPNSFNRLMKPPSSRNPPPVSDGIHDPDGLGAEMLQAPKDSFSSLPKGKSGNYVDWVKALSGGDIQPRYDKLDPDAKPVVIDLNIVREVKGSMPNVVYPHKQHTEWLECSNCHPKIFIPQKGANNMSMAAILLGEGCGVCHGKVAFPVSECRRCHSQPKPPENVSTAGADREEKP